MNNEALLKRFLSQYVVARKQKNVLEARLRQAQLDINMPLGGMGYSDMPRGSGVSEGAAVPAIRELEIEEKINAQKLVMVEKMATVMEVIEYLPSISVERAVLEAKYIDGKSWKEIEAEKNYSRSSCYEYMKRAFNQLLAIRPVVMILDEYRKELQKEAWK